MNFRRYIATVFAALLGMTLWGPGARAADATIKIGYIDPFSGAFAAGGDTSLKQFQFIVDNVNAGAARSARNLNWSPLTTSSSPPRR
jgi:branched-chain amino acid transport system substrate-binding protein